MSPLLIPAARKYAAGAAIRRSQASARHSPPPMAAPLIAAITGWCSRRSVSTTSSSTSIARRAYVGRVTPATPGGVPADSWSAPEQNPLPAPVTTTARTALSSPSSWSAARKRDHHVERHRVHPLRAVEGDDRDLGDRALDQDVGHAGESRARVAAGQSCAVDLDDLTAAQKAVAALLAGLDPDDWSQPDAVRGVGRGRRDPPPRRRRARVHHLAGWRAPTTWRRSGTSSPRWAPTTCPRRTPPARPGCATRSRGRRRGSVPVGHRADARPAIAELRTIECLTHGWDVATATGRQLAVDDAVAERAIAHSLALMDRLPPDRRPFGPPVAGPRRRPAIDRLAGLLGRSVSG